MDDPNKDAYGEHYRVNDYGQIVSDLLKPIPWEEQDRWLARAVVDLVQALAVEKYYVQDYDKYHPVEWFQLSQWERDFWIKSILELRCIAAAAYAELKRRVDE